MSPLAYLIAATCVGYILGIVSVIVYAGLTFDKELEEDEAEKLS